MRNAGKTKYNASSETGDWAACNPTCPEETAEELRQAYRRYLTKKEKQK
jgi:UDPglucose--hexose-1-phosphate uridylyltransferase